MFIYVCEKNTRTYEPLQQWDVFDNERKIGMPGEIIAVEHRFGGQNLTFALVKDIQAEDEDFQIYDICEV